MRPCAAEPVRLRFTRSPHHPLTRSLLLAVASLLAAHPAHAEVTLDGIFPNGAQRGTTVELKLTGTEIPETAALQVDGDGIRPAGPFVKGVGKVEIAADAKPGVRHLRLVGERAATPPRPFSVGALPELAEKEPNDTPEQAQRLDSLPVVLNGQLLTRPDVDLLRVPLKKGECLVVAGESRALGAPTNLLVRIRATDRRELLVQMDSRTRDPLLGFTAPEDGDYLVELLEVMNNYSNLSPAYNYRVTLTKGPWIDHVSPPGAQAGATARLTFHGWNLAGAPGPGSVDAEVAIPADGSPTLPVTAGGAPNTVPLLVGKHPEQLEVEAAAGPQPITLPVTINGTLAGPDDRDRFRFQASAGKPLLIDLQARRLTSLADPVVLLFDGTGKFLVREDDTEVGGRDPYFHFTPPADGAYTLTVRDVASRGGAGFFYRLTVAPAEPSLALTTSLPTLILKPGEKLEVPLTVARRATPEPVDVTIEGLPSGVTAEPLTIPAGGPEKRDVKLVLTTTKELPPGSWSVRILGTLKGGPPAAARAEWVLATDRSGTLAEGATDRLLLLVPAPVKP